MRQYKFLPKYDYFFLIGVSSSDTIATLKQGSSFLLYMSVLVTKIYTSFLGVVSGCVDLWRGKDHWLLKEK